MSGRRGAGLAELFVALTLGGVLMSAAVGGLAQHLRQRHDREAQQSADAAVRDVIAVLRAEVAHAAGAVRVLGDTALELASVRALASACDVVGGRLIIPGVMWSAPRAGDSLAVMDTLTRAEWRTTIATVGTLRSSARCPAGGARVTPSMPLPPTAVPVALPVRVWRVVRYVLYRGSEGEWWLGERACAPTCGAAQPVAGPVLPYAQHGLEMVLRLDGSGRPVSIDVAARATVGGRATRMSARLPVPR